VNALGADPLCVSHLLNLRARSRVKTHLRRVLADFRPELLLIDEFLNAILHRCFLKRFSTLMLFPRNLS